jgi:hypothetical protein
MLDQNNRFPLQQEIESFSRSIDFEQSVDDENDENDSREEPEIDQGETFFYLILFLGQNIPVLISLWITPAEEGYPSDAWVPWGRLHTACVEKQGILVQDTISAIVPE